jgi:hypothetical protein
MPIVLCKVIKLPGVVVHRTVPLAQLQKLDKLVAYGAHWKVVTTESIAELIPCHMLICS